MTGVWLILWWEVVKKLFRDMAVYGWPLAIFLPIVWGLWLWKRQRRLSLRPRIEPVYQALMEYLVFTRNNGRICGPHWSKLDQMVKETHFLFKGKVEHFLRKLLQEGRQFQGSDVVREEGVKWAKKQEVIAKALFCKMLKV